MFHAFRTRELLLNQEDAECIFDIRKQRAMKTNENTVKNVLIKAMTIFVITLSLGLQKVQAQDYVLNFSDPTTYYITCGRVNAGMWSVKNDTCMLFTPYLRVEVEAGATVSFVFRVNQSGSGDQYDRGYVYHSIDAGNWVSDQTWTAGGFPAVYTFNTSVFLEKDHFVQFMVRLSTNNKTEFWAILDGNISATDNDDANHNVAAYLTQPPIPGNLPIQLISFTGKNVNGNNILEWTTASETNSDYFIIERSEDGTIFYEIGEIKGAGNSNSILKYEFKDSNPLTVSYYRLRQVDFDGNFTYSPVIELSSNSEKNEIHIFSTGSEIAICANTENTISPEVTVYNMTGQIVYCSVVTIQEGASYTQITPDITTEGLYLVYITSGNQVLETAKIFF